MHRIKLKPVLDGVDATVIQMKKWLDLEDSAPSPILKKHCSECQFQADCAKIMIDEDSLSLLTGLTPKSIQDYRKKGIFTLTQLSYQFRPRKSNKKIKIKPIYKAELQALAKRTQKTYVVHPPEIDKPTTSIFLDIEGIPEQKFTYLIGIQLVHKGKVTTHSFWADSPKEEGEIWQSFLDLLNKYPDAPIFHYGQYEFRVCKGLIQKYSAKESDHLKRFTNVVSFIYGRVYFPTYGNNLKDIGRHLGIKWPQPIQSGIETLVWRKNWKRHGKEQLKQDLIRYNLCDCKALSALVDHLRQLPSLLESDGSCDHAYSPKKQSSDKAENIHQNFEDVLLLGHSRYSARRISFVKKQASKDNSAPKKRSRPKTVPLKITRTIIVAPRRKCPKCKNSKITIRRKTQEAIVVDLHFTKNGCRKSITRFTGPFAFCSKCQGLYGPRQVKKHLDNRYGLNFQAFTVYQRMALRLSLRIIAQSVFDIFGISIASSNIAYFTKAMSDKHALTERRLLEQILQSCCLHCDETKVNISGENHYVWVFTDGRHVWFKSTETREAQWVHELLSGYSGILVSDFFAGYDSPECRQQKCLSHLIRDLNDDLWKEPFNHELELFAESFKILICGIMETIQKYGSKIRNLRKHQKKVAQFYKTQIHNVIYSQDATKKYQKRFQRYEDSLFTFLTDSDIPWNNNLAERALRHLAIQRKISGSFGKDGIHRYLRLLSISQTCRFQEKSCLRFLRSGSKDVDAFS